jgi:hypothetical protein
MARNGRGVVLALRLDASCFWLRDALAEEYSELRVFWMESDGIEGVEMVIIGIKELFNCREYLGS